MTVHTCVHTHAPLPTEETNSKYIMHFSNDTAQKSFLVPGSELPALVTSRTEDQFYLMSFSYRTGTVCL